MCLIIGKYANKKLGTMLNITHISATPVGMDVHAEAEVIEVENNTITFQIIKPESLSDFNNLNSVVHSVP